MEHTPKITAIMLVTVAIIGSVGGYTWISSTYLTQIKHLEKRVNTLTFEIFELRKKVLSQTEILTLKNQIFDKSEDLQGLQSIMTNVQTTNGDLASQIQLYNVKLNELQKDYIEFEENLSELDSTYTGLKASYDAIYKEYQIWNDGYQALKETIVLHNVNDYQQISFDLTIPSSGYVSREFFFDVGYGIIIRTWIDVDVEGLSFKIGSGSSWTRDGQGGFLGSSSRDYTNLPSILYGYAYCEIVDEGGNEFKVEVGIRPEKQTSWNGRASSRYFSKVSDD